MSEAAAAIAHHVEAVLHALVRQVDLVGLVHCGRKVTDVMPAVGSNFLTQRQCVRQCGS